MHPVTIRTSELFVSGGRDKHTTFGCKEICSTFVPSVHLFQSLWKQEDLVSSGAHMKFSACKLGPEVLYSLPNLQTNRERGWISLQSIKANHGKEIARVQGSTKGQISTSLFFPDLPPMHGRIVNLPGRCQISTVSMS